jgi:hypothetical protein
MTALIGVNVKVENIELVVPLTLHVLLYRNEEPSVIMLALPLTVYITPPPTI